MTARIAWRVAGNEVTASGSTSPIVCQSSDQARSLAAVLNAAQDVQPSYASRKLFTAIAALHASTAGES